MSRGKLTRDDLVKLARQIQDAKDTRKDYSKLLAELQRNVPYPNVKDLLLISDQSAEYIVDFSLNWKEEWPKLSKEELIDLVDKIRKVEGTEAEIDVMVQIFEANCQHPAKTDLIFYPDDHFEGNSEPATLQIVEKALSGQ